MTQKQIKILDAIFSGVLMISFVYASYYGEKFNESLQYNSINLITSFVFGGLGIVLKTPGMTIRQFFFGTVSFYNLWHIACCSYLLHAHHIF